MSEVQLRFGCRQGRLWHISEVASGFGCRCSCPGCGRPLVAYKGTVKAHYFGHQPVELAAGEAPCSFGPETALHLYAKQLIAGQPTFLTPPLAEKGAAELLVEDAQLEQSHEGITPDVTITTVAGRIFAEVAVTHFADQAKLTKLQLLGMPTVEINLRDIDWSFPLEQLQVAVLRDVTRRVWVHHPQLTKEPPPVTGPEFVPLAPATFDLTELEPEQYAIDPNIAGQKLLVLASRINASELDQVLRGAPSVAERTRLYCLLDPAEKLAYHSHRLGVSPGRLAVWLYAGYHDVSPFVEHQIVWRTGVLARFVAKNRKPFSVSEVEQWCAERYNLEPLASQPVTEGDGALWKMSHLTFAVFRWLEALSQLSYLKSDGWRPEHRSYTPAGRLYAT